MTRPDTIDQAREIIRSAEHAVFFTGAGLGAESGIPTFRGSGGLWEGFRAEELASPVGFARHPEKVWEWYRWRRATITEAEPHAGHRAIAEYQRAHPSARIVTQNVDGMHQRTGCREVLELHGSIWVRRCQRCGAEEEDASLEGVETGVPTCSCGGHLRPGVVWFGESLPRDVWGAAEIVMGRADVVLVVGTSAVVQPAASLAQRARSQGARLVEVNPDPALGGWATVVAETAARALPLILGPEPGGAS